MTQPTPNYNLIKYSSITDTPEVFEDYIDNTSNNFEIIDTELKRIEEQSDFYKTGWDDNQIYPEISFDDITRTFTITGNGATYWINNIQYQLDIDAEIIIPSIEGIHFFYFTSSGIQASTTIWPLDNTACPISVTYWDVPNSKHLGLGYEFHKWILNDNTHLYLHDTRGTVYSKGLGATQVSTTTIRVDTGSAFDEDIELRIGDNIGSLQILNPLTAPIIYRIGVNGDLRSAGISSNLCYLNPGPEINTFNGSIWQMEPVNNNKYFCYWLIATNDTDAPIILMPGQVEGGTLNEADELNTLSAMDFGHLRFAEFVVLSRIMMLSSPSSYQVVRIDDYRLSKGAASGAVAESPAIVMDVVANIAIRDAIINPPTGKQVHVIDASGDFDIYTGWAQYIYAGGTWVRTNEDHANTTYGVFHQLEADPYKMITTGINSYNNNKVNLTLTISKVAGGLSLGAGRIEHTGKTLILAFNATATIRTPSTPDTSVWFVLVKNGNEFVFPSSSFGRIESLGGAMSVDAASCVEVSDGDYLEVYCKTNKLNAEFWVEGMQLQFIEVPQ